MPGFFSSNSANKLTALSNHFLDWSRVGSLIASGTHRYSWHELVQRGFIITSMGVGAYSGYQYSDEESLGLTSGLYSMAGCFVAFAVSHCIVLAPLVYKRKLMQQQCQESEKTVLSLLNTLNEVALDKDLDKEQVASLMKQVTSVVGDTLSLNLSDDAQARASQTWGMRARLMGYIVTKLAADVEYLKDSAEPNLLLNDMLAFWSKPQSDLHEALKESVTASSEESVGLKLS